MTKLSNPKDLYYEALAEKDKRFLEPHRQTIFILRSKRFSYRQIANWLKERGVDVDHNEIYREHTKHMNEKEIDEQERCDHDIELNAAD